MNGLNRVYLIGHLGADPESRSTSSGTNVARLSLATPRRVKRGDQWVEESDWHRLTAFGRTADFLVQYGRKGSALAVEATLRTNKWTDRDNQTRTEVQIIIDTVLYLREPRGGSDDRRGYGGQGDRDTGHGQGRGGGGAPPPHDEPPPYNDEDIPF